MDQPEYFTFNDVLIVPQFSEITTRANCDTSTKIMGVTLKVPIVSANMATLTEDVLSNKMHELGGAGVLHRFMSIEQNVEMYKASPQSWCSVGVGEVELERASALKNVGCKQFVLDVAHGASKPALDQYIKLRYKLGGLVYIAVGNFATGESINKFVELCKNNGVPVPDAFKVGIGSGANCTTRIVAGVGFPQLSSIDDCVKTGYDIIADGGIKTSGDLCKALAVGAKAVMMGSQLAGTDESAGFIKTYNEHSDNFDKSGYNELYKSLDKDSFIRKTIMTTGIIHSGSASGDSYKNQGKIADHRTPEGVTAMIPYKGPLEPIVKHFSAGLKSSLSYVGANNLVEFREKAKFIKISNNTQIENGAHINASN